MIGCFCLLVICWSYTFGCMVLTEQQVVAAVIGALIELALEIFVIALWNERKD